MHEYLILQILVWVVFGLGLGAGWLLRRADERLRTQEDELQSRLGNAIDAARASKGVEMKCEIPLSGQRPGFDFVTSTVTRLVPGGKQEWQAMEIKSPSQEIQVCVTPTGEIRVHDANGEWRKPRIEGESDDL